MATSNAMTVGFVIGGVIGLVVILSAFFELRRRLRKKTVAENEK